jgi:hypothetical protein
LFHCPWEKMSVWLPYRRRKNRNPASFSNVTFPACLIFSRSMWSPDSRSVRTKKKCIGTDAHIFIFLFFCFFVFTRCMLYTYGMSFLIFSLFLPSSRKIPPPPPMDVMVHNLEQNNQRFFKLCMYSKM